MYGDVKLSGVTFVRLGASYLGIIQFTKRDYWGRRHNDHVQEAIALQMLYLVTKKG